MGDFLEKIIAAELFTPNRTSNEVQPNCSARVGDLLADSKATNWRLLAEYNISIDDEDATRLHSFDRQCRIYVTRCSRVALMQHIELYRKARVQPLFALMR